MSLKSKRRPATVAEPPGETPSPQETLTPPTAQGKVPRSIRAWRAWGLSDPVDSPLLWMLDSRVDARCQRLLKKWHRKATAGAGHQRKLARAMAEAIGDLTQRQLLDPPAAVPLGALLQALAVSHWLRQLGCLLDPAEAQRLVDQLWELAGQAQTSNANDQMLIKSLGLELGISLSFASEDPMALDRHFLVEEFESAVESNLDGDGWPDGRLRVDFGLLAASWARSYLLLKKMEVEPAPEIKIQLDWMVRQCLRLRRPDGTLCWSHAPKSAASDEFWQCLLKLSGDRDDRRIWQAGKAKAKSRASGQGPSPLSNPPWNVSEWASGAILRSNWTRKSPRLAVDYLEDRGGLGRFEIELIRNQLLAQGPVETRICVDDQPQSLVGGFELVCDKSDADLDYLEFQIELSGGGTLNRQLLLSRTDEFLIWADLVLPGRQAAIDYRCRWPLASEIQTLPETQTREVYLLAASRHRKIQSLLLPLALPEWKAAAAPGTLHHDGGLELHQHAQGAGLYAPLVWDLHPSRCRQMRTWRTLTVAENRHPVAPDQAVAYRFQLHRYQGLLYRAVGSQGNRTYLGENTTAEFEFSRFQRDGTVTSLIVV